MLFKLKYVRLIDWQGACNTERHVFLAEGRLTVGMQIEILEKGEGSFGVIFGRQSDQKPVKLILFYLTSLELRLANC